MIDEIKVLLGNNLSPVPMSSDTIHVVIGMASEHYKRYRPNTAPDWGTSPRAHSWIMEYSLAYCKLMLGEMTLRSSDMRAGGEMIAVAQSTMNDLERELITYT